MEPSDISDALLQLARVDADIARALPQIGHPAPRISASGFTALLGIIIGQQVSTEAAAAIRGRVDALLDDISAECFLAVDDQALREAGMSWRKIEYANGLAGAIINNIFDPEALQHLPDDEAISAIVSLRGFGRWSAEIYLMFSLQRADIFPADDLALLVALGRLKQLPQKPTPRQARDITAHWAPYRSAGSLFLWHYYRGAPV